MTNEVDKIKYNGGYIQIPLPFVRLLMVQPQKAQCVIGYSIYLQAKRMDFEPTEAYRQIFYHFFQREKNPCSKYYLCQDIESHIKKELPNSFSTNTEYFGFSPEYDGEFKADEEIHWLKEECERNLPLKNLCLLWYGIFKVMENLGVKQYMKGNFDVYQFQCAYEEFEKYHDQLDNAVYGYCKYSIIERFIKDSEETKLLPYDKRLQFAMYVGLKSILGNKQYTRTNIELIKARMFGFRSKKELECELVNSRQTTEINRLIKKYTSYRQFIHIIGAMNEFKYMTVASVTSNKAVQGTWISSSFSEKELREIVSKEARGKTFKFMLQS